MKIGNIDVTSMKIGSTNVAKAYVGSTQVYPSSQPTPTGYTYSVTITGLENGDTTDIVWNFGEYGESSVGNGTYTYSSLSDPILVEVENYSQDYTIGIPSITLSSSNPSGTITFSKVGGLTHIPQGEDMSQYYNQTITRFKIGDSSFPSGYQTVNLNFQTGGYGSIATWGTNFTFDNTYVSSLPCDVSGSDVITSWTCSDSSWSQTTNNPFTDLWIEFA